MRIGQLCNYSLLYDNHTNILNIKFTRTCNPLFCKSLWPACYY